MLTAEWRFAVSLCPTLKNKNLMGLLDSFGGAFGLGSASSILDFGLGMAADAFSRQQDWIYQQKAMDMQYKYDQKAADAAFQRDLNMFNIENEYNSPAQQLARLKSAGLSPALMQGGTSQVAGQMGGSATPSVNANFNGGNSGIGAFMGSFMQNVSAYKQLGLIDAQTDEMLQRVVSAQLSDFIKKVVGKEEWMRIRDSSETYGFSNSDKDDVDKFFGIGSERAEGAVSPTQTAEDVARSQIKSNKASASASDAAAGAYQAEEELRRYEAVTESALLSLRIDDYNQRIAESRARVNNLSAEDAKLFAETRNINILTERLEFVDCASAFYGFPVQDLPKTIQSQLMLTYRRVLTGEMYPESAVAAAEHIIERYQERELHIPRTRSQNVSYSKGGLFGLFNNSSQNSWSETK